MNSYQETSGILVSDFDGTMTRFDFYDLACRCFPEISGDYWQRYERGEVTHFDALRMIFAGIRASNQTMEEIIASMEFDPGIPDAIASLRQEGWEVCVASAGCAWYIERIFKAYRVEVTLYANPGEYSPSTGLALRLPKDSPFFSQELGVSKLSVVRDALKRFSKVAFAGDGRPDLAPALLVPPERRFARKWLARKLHELGEEFRPFERWPEIVSILNQDNGER